MVEKVVLSFRVPKSLSGHIKRAVAALKREVKLEARDAKPAKKAKSAKKAKAKPIKKAAAKKASRTNLTLKELVTKEASRRKSVTASGLRPIIAARGYAVSSLPQALSSLSKSGELRLISRGVYSR